MFAQRYCSISQVPVAAIGEKWQVVRFRQLCTLRPKSTSNFFERDATNEAALKIWSELSRWLYCPCSDKPPLHSWFQPQKKKPLVSYEPWQTNVMYFATLNVVRALLRRWLYSLPYPTRSSPPPASLCAVVPSHFSFHLSIFFVSGKIPVDPSCFRIKRQTWINSN